MVMGKIILDTNFIISCVKNKIDLFDELKLMGFQIIIPTKIISELKKVVASKQKAYNREAAELALKILQKNSYEEIDLGLSHADKSIIKFAKEYPKAVIATLDKELKDKISNNKLVIRGKKKLEII